MIPNYLEDSLPRRSHSYWSWQRGPFNSNYKGSQALGHQVHLATKEVYTTTEKSWELETHLQTGRRFAGKESTVVGNIWKIPEPNWAPTAMEDKVNAYKRSLKPTL